MRFTDELRAAADELWEAQHAHPFVRGIGDGTLEPERFRWYVRQDYLFLIEYGRLLSLASARSPRLELQERFAELALSTLRDEMELHRSYAEEWGVGRDELEREEAAPATRGYVDFLLRTASLGDFAELVAALLPCMWGYAELAERLGSPPHALYARWLAMYTDPGFRDLAAWCRVVVDEAATTGDRGRMRRAFVESSRHELAFWDAAWNA